MNHKVISVTFEVDAQSYKNGRFSIPSKICSLMEIDSGDEIIVEIKGEKKSTKLTSGKEIDGFENLVKAGERIHVTVSL